MNDPYTPSTPDLSTAGWPPATGASATTPTDGNGAGHTTDTAKAEAGEVKDTAVSAAQDVAATAKGQAQDVAGEIGQQSRQLLSQTTSELSSQASTQQNRLADGLGSYAGQLRSMASNSEQSGLMTDLVHQAADRGEKAASYLADHEPSDLLDDVKSFARRRPALFLGLAAGAGILVGRFSRGLLADAKGGDPALQRKPAARVDNDRPSASLEEIPTSGSGAEAAYAPVAPVDPLVPVAPVTETAPIYGSVTGPADGSVHGGLSR